MLWPKDFGGRTSTKVGQKWQKGDRKVLSYSFFLEVVLDWSNFKIFSSQTHLKVKPHTIHESETVWDLINFFL